MNQELLQAISHLIREVHGPSCSISIADRVTESKKEGERKRQHGTVLQVENQWDFSVA